MVGTTPAHQIDSTISNICARPAKRHCQAVVPRRQWCHKDDGADMHRRQRQSVLKMSDDAERVTRESGTQISSNTSHIISFQEANCSSDSNTRAANALRNGARNNRSNSASNNQNIKIKYSVHH
jgi:hypothetical protein